MLVCDFTRARPTIAITEKYLLRRVDDIVDDCVDYDPFVRSPFYLSEEACEEAPYSLFVVHFVSVFQFRVL